MKSFFKTLLASCLGMTLALVILFFVVFGWITKLVISSVAEPDSPPIKPHSILKIDFSSISEVSIERPLEKVLNPNGNALTLTDVISGIRKAKNNPDIEGIYLSMEQPTIGAASVEAVRRALLDFKKSGKFIVAYGDNFSQKGYLIATTADRLALNPEGMIPLVGLSLNTMLYKNALDKLGVKMNVFKVGTFKSAVEPYILSDKISDANREQQEEFLSGLWNSYLGMISESRGISKEELNKYAQEGTALDAAEKYLSMGLVDTLVLRSEVEGIVKGFMEEPPKTLHQVTLAQMQQQPDLYPKGGDAVAVVYAEGEIMDEGVPNPLEPQHSISYKLAERIAKLEEDEGVKAVVLRINSPGGSAFLSEQIYQAIRKLSEKKPVVASMGDYAASGGYYIAAAANKIVAERNTLTGSIGIFGLMPDASSLASKIGISVDAVSTSPYASLVIATGDGSSLLNPMSPEAQEKMQALVERGYKTFLSRVSQGRGMTPQEVDQVGQGRVWLGSKAQELGLVDLLGGLDLAIEEAAKLAKLDPGYAVRYDKRESSLLEALLGEAGEAVSDRFEAGIFSKELEREARVTLKRIMSHSGLQARLPYSLSIY